MFFVVYDIIDIEERSDVMPNDKITVNSVSIRPLINVNESQIIFQRHCNYDRLNGGLTLDSAEHQKAIVKSFIKELKENLTIDELKNTYFLFVSSETKSTGNFKRCVETTNIALSEITNFFKENNVSCSHIINLNESLNYKGNIKESGYLTEPKMFEDSSGFLDYLKNKHGGMNQEFWIDFEEDLSKEKRQEFNSEGPDEIVDRGVRYVNILQRYAKYFHLKKPNSRLIIWAGTHYDLISPLVKQRVLNYEKSDIVNVEYCGGVSFVINELNQISINVNGFDFPFDSQYSKQHHRHF